MRTLALAGNVPYPGHVFSGIFNERCVAALAELCDSVDLLAPRPYVPRFLSFIPRWKAYSTIKQFELRDGIPVYRPSTLVIPRVGSALWVDFVSFLGCRRLARKLHCRSSYDAVVSFNLVETGGIAWRIAKDLGIPASGWATGDDVRFPKSSPLGRVVARAIERLDVVFYQSHELLEKAAQLVGSSLDSMSPDRHIVLAKGIPSPPVLPRDAIRHQVRKEWGISGDRIVVFNSGRFFREKGIFELLEAVQFAAGRNSDISCVIVGSNPAFDETSGLQRELDRTPQLRNQVKLLPACTPDKVWKYLCAADIYAFPSHKEGMPNSLLEAMAMGLPAVAFAIPPVLEIDAGTGALVTVPPFDSKLFGEALLCLADSPGDRSRIGERGKDQVMSRFMVRKNMAVAVGRLSELVGTKAGQAIERNRHECGKQDKHGGGYGKNMPA